MSDIIERLRSELNDTSYLDSLYSEAANEIEWLREELRKAKVELATGLPQ